MDEDFPYPHLDPEEDPNWVEPENDNNPSKPEEMPF